MKKQIKTTEAIAFDPYIHGCNKAGGKVGTAFKSGVALR